MSFIEIVADNTSFEWRPSDPSGATSESVFVLRKLSRAERQQFQRQHTSKKWVRGVQQERLDAEAFADDVLDAVIVSWRDIYVLEPNGSGMTRRALECERPYKIMLPETLKAEIVQMCVGGDMGAWEDGGHADQARPISPTISTGSETKEST